MLKKEQVEFYNFNGYLILKDYIDLKDLQELKDSFHFLVDSFLKEKNPDLKTAINKLEKIDHSKLYLCQKIIASSSKAIKLISNLNIDEIYSKIYSVDKNHVHLQPMQTPVQFPNDDRFDFRWHQESGSYKGFSKKSIGKTLSELMAQAPPLFGGNFTTPIATLKQSALTNNISAMSKYCEEIGFELAPHVKTHMSPQLAAEQMKFGAKYLTVATMWQARVFLEFGFKSIIIANEVSDTVIDLQRAVKKVFDPNSILNPGKKIP